MGLLSKAKSLRKSKKSDKSQTTAAQTAEESASQSQSAQTPAQASSSTSAPLEPKPQAKEEIPSQELKLQPPHARGEAASQSVQEEKLRPLQLGNYDFKTSYTFPSLHDEASSMLNLSLLIYTLSELRDLARNGVLSDPTKSLRILQLPLPLETAFAIIETEAELLKEVLSDGKHDAALSALQSLLDAQKHKKTQKSEGKQVATVPKEEQGMFSGWMDSWNGCLAGGFSFDEIFCGGDLGNVDSGNKSPPAEERLDSSMIYTVGDMKCNEECVYAVGVNPIEERVTVVFRGSVTRCDFLQDAKIGMRRVKEPTLGEGAEDEIGIHQGFFEYLFHSKGGNLSKYEEILGHVTKLFRQDPNRVRNYKLYVTGHSLGGALATLFGYYCAATSSQHQLPLPITIVSVGSPRVGNLAFARSFTELESQGKIRHLRIANHKDPVTLGPTVSSKKALALAVKTFSPLGNLALAGSGSDSSKDGAETYYHTGMKMKLRKSIPATTSARCELSYSGAKIVSQTPSSSCQSQDDDREDLASLMQQSQKLAQNVPMVSYHYGAAYAERMALVEPDLHGLTLNYLYREKACL